jgi:hypothetical protein
VNISSLSLNNIVHSLFTFPQEVLVLAQAGFRASYFNLKPKDKKQGILPTSPTEYTQIKFTLAEKIQIRSKPARSSLFTPRIKKRCESQPITPMKSKTSCIRDARTYPTKFKKPKQR